MPHYRKNMIRNLKCIKIDHGVIGRIILMKFEIKIRVSAQNFVAIFESSCDPLPGWFQWVSNKLVA